MLHEVKTATMERSGMFIVSAATPAVDAHDARRLSMLSGCPERCKAAAFPPALALACVLTQIYLTL